MVTAHLGIQTQNTQGKAPPLLLLSSFIYYFWLYWVFTAGSRLSLVAMSWGYSLSWCMVSPCRGFSCCRARAVAWAGSVVVARGLSSCGSWALEHGLNSCGAWIYLFLSTWDPPKPGNKPLSPALAGGFFTTEPPGKPLAWHSYSTNATQNMYYLLELIFSVARNILLGNRGLKKKTEERAEES